MGTHTTSLRSDDANDPARADEWVRASQIIGELEALTGSECPVGVRRLLDLAASNRVSLEMRNGRWGTRRGRLPVVAAELGMVPKAPAFGRWSATVAASAAVPA